MANKNRSKSQAKSDRAALRKLIKTGLYTGKADLRKAPTRYQRDLISKFADVVKGRAAVVAPKNPKSYRDRYRVKGSKVVVPKGKRETIKTDKEGKITISGKSPRGRKYRQTLKRADEKLEAGKTYYTWLGTSLHRIGDAADVERFKVKYPRHQKHPEWIVETDIDDDNEDDDERIENQIIKQIRRKRRERKSNKKSGRRKRGKK